MRSIVCLMAVLCLVLVSTAAVHGQGAAPGAGIRLPEPKYDGNVSVEKALKERRSVRVYKDSPLSVAEVSQVLFAAQGITEPGRGLRTAPSARARYYLTVYLFAGNVTGLKPGMYRYVPQGHSLALVAGGDAKGMLYKAAGQAPVDKAPAALVIAGSQARATNEGWMYLEAGHAAQNVYLQCVPLGLGTVVMAGFNADAVDKVIGLPAGERTLYIMPLGRK
ncbi:MAG TPA: SagB/ThcOx family dehydrogenase [Syntrophorhabdaceae bacterium]|nr:SagB/ThcOx family dehydrogenase [Syntrophorhabdaceae bacterium]HOD74954.1 SagB/ThcOx family dehydrogenase [Syntrophorhabdaceae bacterium]